MLLFFLSFNCPCSFLSKSFQKCFAIASSLGLRESDWPKVTCRFSAKGKSKINDLLVSSCLNHYTKLTPNVDVSNNQNTEKTIVWWLMSLWSPDVNQPLKERLSLNWCCLSTNQSSWPSLFLGTYALFKGFNTSWSITVGINLQQLMEILQ